MSLRRAVLGGVLSVLVVAHIEAATADSLTDLSAAIRAEFPEVSIMTTQEWAEGMKDALRPVPILLDVREEREYAVSHQPEALRAESDPVAQLRRLGASSRTSVVVYCSVGYRSALLARKLSQAGFSNVRNLEGSIFAWANEGRPLVNSHGPTDGVHPFDVRWGRYLEKSKWHWKPVISSLR